MQQVIFVHGGETFADYQDYLDDLQNSIYDPYKESQKRWSENLATDLGEGFEVLAPRMPNKYNAKYLEWKIWFEKVIEFAKPNTVLVGWSLGGIFLTKFLSENIFPVNIKKLILVAPVFDENNLVDKDGKQSSLADFQLNVNKLINLKQILNITIFHSEDDFVVPFSHTEKYLLHLPHAKLVVFQDRNHFLQSQFPELLEEIRFLKSGDY